jgi:FkbM family methyltransferase
MIQCFGASHVYAFEPIQSNRILLAENLAIPGCASQATIVGCAVGDEDGTADFQIDDLTSNSGTLDAVTRGAASQSRSQYGLPPATTRVTISRLDTLIATQGLTAPGVMKLDVEGAEALALRGAKHLLSVQKPRLVVELHGAKFARQVLEILWSLGYHCFGRLNMNDASTYKELTLADLESMTNRGPIPYIAASCAYEDLTQPIENFHVSERSR